MRLISSVCITFVTAAAAELERNDIDEKGSPLMGESSLTSVLSSAAILSSSSNDMPSPFSLFHHCTTYSSLSLPFDISTLFEQNKQQNKPLISEFMLLGTWA